MVKFITKCLFVLVEISLTNILIFLQKRENKRIEITESLCVIDKEHFFHKGRITIPIIDHKNDLVFNVWTSISEENFIKRNDLWSEPERIRQEPYFGKSSSINRPRKRNNF